MHRRDTVWGPRALLPIVLLPAFLGLQACANYHVRIPSSDPTRVEGQKGEYAEKTVNAYFWGLVMDPQVLSAECKGQGINDVFIDRSLGHDLVSVLTLGIWMPLDVRYRCKAQETQGGKIK